MKVDEWGWRREKRGLGDGGRKRDNEEEMRWMNTHRGEGRWLVKGGREETKEWTEGEKKGAR